MALVFFLLARCLPCPDWLASGISLKRPTANVFVDTETAVAVLFCGPAKGMLDVLLGNSGRTDIFLYRYRTWHSAHPDMLYRLVAARTRHHFSSRSLISRLSNRLWSDQCGYYPKLAFKKPSLSCSRY